MLKKRLARWVAWRDVSTNRRIFSAMLVVVVMFVAAKLAVAAKELVVAGYFGTGEVVDAFLIAFLLPLFFINVLADSFSAAMMPTYIHTRDSAGLLAANQLFSSILMIGALFLVIATIGIGLLAPVLLPLLGSGFDKANLALSLSLFYWLLPVLLLTGIARLYSMAMNASERFAAVALLPAVTPVCAVIFLVSMADKWGIHALAAGTLLGSLAELAILAMLAKKRDIPLLPRWYGMSEELGAVVGQYGPVVASALLMSGTVLVDQTMAAMLAPGSLAALNYANKVIAVIMGVGAMAIGTVILPYFSRMISVNDWDGVKNTFNTYARLILIVSIPLSAVLFLLAEPIVKILFERGEFSVEDTQLVGQVLSFYALQIPFYVLGILSVRLISSIKENQILMWGTAISLVLNICLNYIFMSWIGVAGIALSTACVYAVSLLYLSLMLSKKMQLLKQYDSN